MYYKYLNDSVFLKQLDEIKHKHIFTKLLLLDKHSRVEEELMGYAKEGSTLGIDGSSAVRRTCSLSLVMDGSTEEKNARIQNLLSLNRKMKLQIGVKNVYQSIFPDYATEDFFWFPLGVFFINTVSYSNSEEGLIITLSLSDKMCLLNGENGGVIPADTVLNTMETYVPETTEGTITKNNEEEDATVMTGRMIMSQGEQVPIEEIITELVNHFGAEDLTNIVLDLPENIRLCQGWGGNSFPLYCEYESTSGQVGKETVDIKDFTQPKNYFLKDDIKNQMTNDEKNKFKSPHKLANSINEKDRQYIILRKKQIVLDEIPYDYYIMKDGPLEDPDTSEYGQTSIVSDDTTTEYEYKNGISAKDLVLLNASGDIGFTFTDLVYPNTSNDFIATKGSAITDSLDSIKQVLENYEYFYDTEGRFRFQEIKNYLNTSQSTDFLNSLKASKKVKKDWEEINKVEKELITKQETTNENSNQQDAEEKQVFDTDFIQTNYSLDKYRDTVVYDFSNSPLIIDISNDPQYSLIKNDFIIWGENGSGLPIRYHVAIDDIPDSNWCYTQYWMYSKMVSLDTAIDSIDTTEGGYVDTLTCLKDIPTAQTKGDFPAEGQLDTFYYMSSKDYTDDNDDCDKVYYWNGVDYYIYYCNGSGKYSFTLDNETDEQVTELLKKYNETDGTVAKEWHIEPIEDTYGNKSNYYTMQITEENKEKEAAQVALDHPPYIRTVKITKTLDDGTQTDEYIPEIVDGRGYQVRYVRYDTTDDWRSSIFLEGKINELDGTANNNPYYAELKNEWPKIVNIYPPEKEGGHIIGFTDSKTDDDDKSDGITLELKDSLDLTQATYYLDILNPSDRIKKFSVSAIGRRSDVYTETGVNCIFEDDLPPYVYIDNQMVDKIKKVKYSYKEDIDDKEEEAKTEYVEALTDFSLEMMQQEITKRTNELQNATNSELTANQSAFLQTAYDDICSQIKTATELGYNPVILYHSQYKKLLGGGAACSAYEQAKNIIYQGTGYNEKITVTMMPVYYLEPNTRIRLQDTATGINGEYVIDSIDLPLDGTGTMSIVCSRALTKM